MYTKLRYGFFVVVAAAAPFLPLPPAASPPFPAAEK